MTIRRKRTRQQHTLLNCDEFSEMVCGPEDAMVCVPEHYRGFGGDVDAMRQAWERHRDAILAWWLTGEYSMTENCSEFCDRVFPFVFTAGAPGSRPWAWWQFDAPEEPGDDEDEESYLRRLDLLLPGEAEAIEDWACPACGDGR